MQTHMTQSDLNFDLGEQKELLRQEIQGYQLHLTKPEKSQLQGQRRRILALESTRHVTSSNSRE